MASLVIFMTVIVPVMLLIILLLDLVGPESRPL
jgi:hypothetical protein